MKSLPSCQVWFKRYKFGLLKKDFKNYLHVYRDGDQYAMGMIALPISEIWESVQIHLFSLT